MSSSYKGPRASAKAATTSHTASQESSGAGSGLSNGDGKNKQNPSRQPDLTKYAKYLQDDDALKFDESRYKPTIRAERHQVGYSASLNQRRNRANAGDPVGVGQNEDPGQRRRPANRPHIRSYSLNRTAASNDSRHPTFQSRADASATNGAQSRLGDNLFTKSRTSRADVLEEEKPDSTTKERVGSSSDNAEAKETLKSASNKATGGPSSRASRSGRSAAASSGDVSDGIPPGVRTVIDENSASSETKDTKATRPAVTKERKKYFETVNEFGGHKISSDNLEQTSSTPKSSSSYFNSEPPQDRADSRRTFLTPDSCWNSKYFPPPYESSADWTNHGSRRFDSSSCRESPIKEDREAENESTFSPRQSYRNGLFEHLKRQESRRSHSLDSRNRTPYRDSHERSPLNRGSSPRRSRIDQMNSLNESNFESKSAFKEHLLNLTMNKDEYEDIMSDFKNGSFVEDVDTKDTDGKPNVGESNVIPEIVVIQVNENSSGGSVKSSKESSPAPTSVPDDEAKEREVASSSEISADKPFVDEVAFDSTDSKTSTKEQEIPGAKTQGDSSNQETDKTDGCNADPEKEAKVNYFRLLEGLIEAARAKYSSPELHKNTESQVILEPVVSEGLTHKWRFQKTEFGIPTSMGITSDGCVIIADYGNSCLEYFSASGDFEHKIEGVKPFGIVVNRKDNIIVGDRRGKAIRVFDKFGADVAQWEAKTFGWISGIAQLQNGHLVICDRDRCKVGIYSEGGENITEFGSYGNNNSQLCMADFLAVDGKNRIIVADSGNHCLKLFDTNGKAVGKISSRGSDDGCLEWPKGICVDRNDNIIVADAHNSRVSMFSTDGNFVQQLLSMTPNPYNVCYGQGTGMLGTLHYSLKGFSQYDVYAFEGSVV